MTSTFVLFALFQAIRELCNSLTLIKCFRNRLKVHPFLALLFYALLFVVELFAYKYYGHNSTPIHLYLAGFARMMFSTLIIDIGLSAAFFLVLFTSCVYAILYNFTTVLPTLLVPAAYISYIKIPLIIFNIVLAIGFFYFLCRDYGEFLCRNNKNKMLFFANIVALLALAAIISQPGFGKSFDLRHLVSRTLIFMPAVLFMGTVIKLLKATDANDKLNENLSNLVKLHESEKQYYDSVLANKDETFIFREMVNQDSKKMLEHLDKKQYEEIDNIFSKVLKNSEKLRHVNLCGNQIIDAVVGYWQLRAWEKNIIFKTNLRIEAINVNDMDLAIILGNVLENAYTAASRIQEQTPVIQVKIACQAQLLLIEISNSFDGKLIIKNDQYLSAKRDFAVPGTGIANVKLLVEKYNGFMEIEHTDNLFKMKIALPN